LTANGGLVLVAETCWVLDVVGAIGRHIGPIKLAAGGVGLAADQPALPEPRAL
jgi:hypothetical protein